MLKVTCHYDKTLKLSPAKLAAQVGHVIARLQLPYKPDKIIVLEANHSKFKSIIDSYKSQQLPFYVHHDLGLTEVKNNTQTVVGTFQIEID